MQTQFLPLPSARKALTDADLPYGQHLSLCVFDDGHRGACRVRS